MDNGYLTSLLFEKWKDNICLKCKRNCTEYCLPLEMLIRLIIEDDKIAIEYINNIRNQIDNSLME